MVSFENRTYFRGVVVQPLKESDIVLELPGCESLYAVRRLELEMVDGSLQKTEIFLEIVLNERALRTWPSSSA